MAKNKHVWTKAETLRLITKYESLPELWDPSSVGYRDKMKKRSAMKSLVNTLQLVKPEISRKINNLRTQFFQEHRKIIRKTEKGYEGVSSPWEFYDRLKFIVVSLSHPHPQPKIMKNEKCIARAQTHEETESEITTTGRVQYSPKPKIRKRSTPILPEDTNLLLRNIIRGMNKPCDENEIFGDFVASELRGIQSPGIKRKLKRVIQTAIIQYSAVDDDCSDEGNTLDVQFS